MSLGDGTTTNRLTPVDVSGLTADVYAATTSYGFSYAVTLDGALKCWGYNGYGALGDGTTTDSLTPVVVSGLTGNPGWPASINVTEPPTSMVRSRR